VRKPIVLKTPVWRAAGLAALLGLGLTWATDSPRSVGMSLVEEGLVSKALPLGDDRRVDVRPDAQPVG
jgi:hypothetical protein